MALLLYQGHASFRLTAAGGAVVYIDPYAGEGYDRPAAGVLVSHEHPDHNAVGKVRLQEGGRVWRSGDMLAGGKYRAVEIGPVRVRAVPAYNQNHSRDACVGFLVEADGVKAYFAGDTSKTDFMATLAGEGLDYAFLPIDGVYNMGPEEAAECAALIGARHTVPIHTRPGRLFDAQAARRFVCPGRLILTPGQEIAL